MSSIAIKPGAVETGRDGMAAGCNFLLPESLIMPVPESCAVVLYCPSCQQVFTRPGHQVGGMVCECGEHDLLQVLEVRRYQDVLNPAIFREPRASKPARVPPARKNKNAGEWAGIIEKCVASHSDGIIWRDLKAELKIASGSLNKATKLLLDDGRIRVKKIGNSNLYMSTGNSRGV